MPSELPPGDAPFVELSDRTIAYFASETEARRFAAEILERAGFARVEPVGLEDVYLYLRGVVRCPSSR